MQYINFKYEKLSSDAPDFIQIKNLVTPYKVVIQDNQLQPLSTRIFNDDFIIKFLKDNQYEDNFIDIWKQEEIKQERVLKKINDSDEVINIDFLFYDLNI